jgi:hypothetical protein
MQSNPLGARSRVTLQRRGDALALMALFALVLFACVKTGSVAVKKPIAKESLPPPERSVAVVVNNPDPEWQRDADGLRDGLLAAFHEKKWWKPGGEPDATFEITLTDFDKGNKAARMFAGTGEAELRASVVIRGKDGAEIGAFDVTGNSRRQSSVTVGGYNTSWGDSLPGRAVHATVEQIVEQVEASR